jgi:hypothetical protein
MRNPTAPIALTGVPVVINLCGEGEHLGAINVNTFNPELLTRKLEVVVASGPCLKADATMVPIRSSSVDEVVGNMLPYEAGWMDRLVGEAFRILKSGSGCRMWATNVGGLGLLPHLVGAGFGAVELDRGYATGTRP